MATENLLVELQRVANNTEVSELIHTFRLFREIGDKNQEVIVQIFDQGKNANPDKRYCCVAEISTGGKTWGNYDSSPERAIDRIHWGNLEKADFGNFNKRG